MLKRVLIANRGEIARRIARTCRRLDVEYVAVYSDADRTAAHLEGAVESVRIGAGPAADSYLNIAALVDAALRTGCDAVHPGYGFLSESPQFATAVAEAGLVYVGPDAAMITAMGDKATARALMAEAGVPILPGSPDATESAGQLALDAAEIGYPVILKPVAGGGGKGMRVVESEAELAEAVAAAVRLGRSSFGDGRLLAERYVPRPRHLEVQVFGDTHGNVVHLFERECSLQRRHQKVVEEAPAANLPAGVREALLEAAVLGARSLGYVNAGTFEFILDTDDRFYFLEANTRLQVEHPVTEEITGVDLVEWQLRVAAGQALPREQHEITAAGHAVECRVYAEDPDEGFRPAPGRAEHVQWPDTIRVEAAFDHPDVVTAFYDPMIAKLIARGPDRPTALRQLVEAIGGTSVLGLTTNLGFLAELLQEPQVVAGRLDTHLVDGFVAQATHRDRAAQAAACAAAMELPATGDACASPWSGTVGALNRQDLDPCAPLGRVLTRDAGGAREAWLTGLRGDGRVDVRLDGRPFSVSVARQGGLFRGTVGDVAWTGLRTPGGFELSLAGHRVSLAARTFDQGDGESVDNVVKSAMPGTVVGLGCAVGDRVAEGDVLVIVEAMKMENRILAPFAGVVDEVTCALHDLVSADQILVHLTAEADADTDA
ncbi:acetyl-CoA/propionyl-CoA carboxylase biotin carboxyl carrier protein [Kitasatospora sp. MAA4]|uniref:acetyl/propionyl/methylcrotonyl-CoA carboxylase subunit alpha n=1 Tax=Kitasatospora sp. MAA4 TaxID=3035093 RepID=UPI002476A1EC|nr:biotin carboxylase N-terminal domain-containing protein [Kitasatospora sp. MAA4]MDH6132772.1 acetyl-CoA/propionyl-CoA carboxylase biotin carboxyl carrier protein [Kitasatospora sp. MAA4]